MYVTGTTDEGPVLARWCEGQRLRSVLVVGLADHTRRLRRVLTAQTLQGALVGHGAVPARGRSVSMDPLSNRACRFPAHGLTMIFSVWLARGISRCPSADANPCPKAAGG